MSIEICNYLATGGRRRWDKRGDLKDTFGVAACLLKDKHDLIHKAVGWMLREAGKQSQPALLNFVSQNYAAMPRTALRYAIERLPEPQRRSVLKGIFDHSAVTAAAQ